LECAAKFDRSQSTIRHVYAYLLVDNDDGSHYWQVEEEPGNRASQKVPRWTDYHIVLEFVTPTAQA